MEIKKQSDVKDCGAVVIQALHKHYHDKWININKIKKEAKYNASGINISNLKELGITFGVALEPLKGSWDALMESKPKGEMITLIEQGGENHYVIFSLEKNKVRIADPIKGKYTLKLNEFKELFTGVLITTALNEYIPSKEKLKSPFKLMLSNPAIMTWTIITLIVSLILTFTSTLFMKLILDKVLPGHLSSLLLVLSVGFGALGILRALNNFFKKYLIKKFQLHIETKLNAEYFYKLRNAKTLDLYKVETSDHLRRISIIESVSSFMANSLFIVFYEIANFAIATSLLLWISPSLFGIALGAGTMVGAFTLIIQYLIKDKYTPLLDKQLDFLNASMDSVFSIEPAKETRVRKYHMDKQNNTYVNYKKTEYSVWNLSTWQGFLSEFVSLVFPIVLTWLASEQVMDSKLTIGSMMMFLGIFHWFISPIEDLCTLGLRYKQNIKNVEMIAFVLNLEPQPINPKGLVFDKIEKLSFNNYIFGYDKGLYSIIWQDFNESFHLTGPNGSGKSTLLKVLATRIFGKGDYSINGTEIDYMNLDELRNKIFFLDSEPYFGNTSILEYITLGDPKAIQRFNKNIFNYNLNKLFSELDISLETQLFNNAQNLSAGQKQIVSLMRLFAFDYDLVILDEALENIDAGKVSWFTKSLAQAQDAIFVEVSHSKRFITKGKEVSIEEITQHID